MRALRHSRRAWLLGVVGTVGVVGVGAVFGLGSRAAIAAGLPVGKLVAVAVRALAYDRGLKDRVDHRLDILVVHDGSATASRDATEVEQGLSALSGVVVQGATLQAAVVTVVDAAALKAALDARAPDVIWVCGGAPLGNAAVAEARARRLTTITLEPALLDSGIMLAVDGSGDKPKLVVHLGETRAAGVDFAADLLKLARVIR